MARSPVPILVVLVAVGVGLVCVGYMWAQRSLLTGRCVHWECGKRSWALLALLVSFCTATACLLAVYEVHQAGLFGTSPDATAEMCTGLVVVSQLVWAGFAAPHVLRALRVIVLYESSLRSRCGWALDSR